MYSFEGQAAIVTGGTRGIGRSIAEGLLQAGARIVATYSSNEAAAAQFKQDNVEFADKVDVQKYDVSKYVIFPSIFALIFLQ